MSVKNKKLPMQRQGSSNDFQTPFYGVIPILKYIPKNWTIWECAAGNGNLVAGFRDREYKVIGSDIHTGQDFLNYIPDEQFDCIITNPPYSLKQQFLQRAYELGKPFAFLVPLTSFESKKRQDLFRKFGLEVILLDGRIDFETPSGAGSSAWFATAWFTNGLNIGKQLTFEHLDKPKC
jgi:hypothetical protein